MDIEEQLRACARIGVHPGGELLEPYNSAAKEIARLRKSRDRINDDRNREAQARRVAERLAQTRLDQIHSLQRDLRLARLHECCCEGQA